MLLLLMLTSKGMAGVPRASLVVIAATLTSFNLPEAGLLLIIGIDQFLDMGRSATNVHRQLAGDRRCCEVGRRAAAGPRQCTGPGRAAGAMMRYLLLAMLLVAFAFPAAAQDATQDVGRLTGTLAKVRATGTITLGVRDSALPFSYRLPNGTPVGYAVELCREIVDDVVAELGGKQIAITYKTVTPEDRISRVVSGDIDLECGSTTRNAERARQVAFSPVFFIAGTKLLVARDSPIQSFRIWQAKPWW